jgi:hypothetical protein
MPLTVHMGSPNFPRLREDGGELEGDDEVPVKVSDGEFIVSPEDVLQIGGGDQGKGHQILDQFILASRNNNIETQKNLPPPAQD